MRSNERIDAFSKIYEEKIWGEEPRSGDGSRPEAALPYVKYLSEVISKYQVTSILDIGHGDWAMWPKDFFKNIKYLGVDAAEGLSDEMQIAHGGGSIEFRHLDAISELPNGFDLVMCKDVVQHLPASDCIKLLNSLVDPKLVLICSDIKNDSILGRLSRFRSSLAPRARFSALLKFESPFLSYGIPHNTEIQPGSWQSIDLREAPFNLQSLGFELIDTFEFDGSPHYGNLVRKRVYLLAPIKVRNNG
jgi:2-polyprenyl-3-methyl-5-hydroxy-6-metoxy-1,4-benzoquinol methylase